MSTHAPPVGLPGQPLSARRLRWAPGARRAGAAAFTGTAGGVALLAMVVLTLLIVLIADARANVLAPPSRAGFPSWLSGPLGGVFSPVSFSTNTLKWEFSIVMFAMFACYLVVLASASRVNPRWAVAAVVIAHVVLFLSPPLLLTDAFNYLNYGRMGVEHGLNPYAQIPSIEPHTDGAYLLSNWHHLLSPYGPLFTLFTYALVPLGVAGSFWVLKLAIGVASLLLLRGIWRCAELLGRPPLYAFLFVGANPLVLMWGLGGDHNDFFMVGFLVAAVYLLLRAREDAVPPAPLVPAGVRRPGRPAPAATGAWFERGAGAALVGAVAIKASAGILLPVFVAALPRRRHVIAGLGVAGAAMLLTTVEVFGRLPDLGDQSAVVTGIGLPNLIGYFAGLGGESEGLRTLLNVILLVAVAGAVLYGWRTRDWLTAAGASMFALLLTLGWELPWYIFWMLPFAVLSGRRWLRVAALVWGAYLILIWVPVTNDVINSIDFKPTSTPLGEQHSRLTYRLLH